MNNAAIILAAGQGKRLGLNQNKILLPLAGKPLVYHTLKTFASLKEIKTIVVVAHKDEKPKIKEIVQEFEANKTILITCGGDTRQESVLKGLLALEEIQPEKVLIHDGARCFVSKEVILRVLERIEPSVAITCGVGAIDSLREVDNQLNVIASIDRNSIYAVQTPQGFVYQDILAKHQQTAKLDVSDDAQLFATQILVEGDYQNKKITTPADWEMAKALTKKTRIGQGFDIHQLVPGRDLILGGVKVPYEKGLLGHSDADVLIHAIIDALLGALALGDIGEHFPDSDQSFKDITSRELLTKIKTLLDIKGAMIENIDATILAQAPKLSLYKAKMQENIAFDLGILREKVSIKATTTEKLGPIGQGEGIAAMAITLVSI